MHDRRAQVIDDHDGDTATMILDQDFGDTKLMDVRFAGVYAPELKDVGGSDTQLFVADWFKKAATGAPYSRWPYIVTTLRMKRTDREQKTLDRYVGTITNWDGTRNLNHDVNEFIHAQGFGGGTGSVTRV